MNHYHPLQRKLKGGFHTDLSARMMYATDASIFRELPEAVAYPANKQDLKTLVQYANENKTCLIPRTAGTSLAGQCVGKGIVVDVSKYMTQILDLNIKEKWVKVQPGVILSELNHYLEPYGLFFGPETSTANRCMIGGMVGNNACGLHSLVYGSTRDHTLEISAIMSDGSEVLFKDTDESPAKKAESNTLEAKVYKKLMEVSNNREIIEEIEKNYPHPDIPRRNSGYALDLLFKRKPFNLCNLLAGSEGTLAFFTEIKLNLVPLPPKEKVLVCVHLESVEQALEANLVALEFNPSAIELMDKTILDLTKKNIEQQKNRFFVKGEPGAILMIEFVSESISELDQVAENMQAAMQSKGFGFHFPVLKNNEIQKAWNLRKAGLGILSNMAGNAKPVAVIEDTAVNVKDLPSYIRDLNLVLKKLQLQSTYHAHIATGELHVRPVLDLRKKNDREKLKQIATETALLIKKYNGTFSGEHGDGRLRGYFNKTIFGETLYELFKEIKLTFDPKHIFNPGKIVDVGEIDQSLRFFDEKEYPKIKTYFDFSRYGDFISAIEKCNGSADCRKTEITGGTMCPSYMATRDEMHSTRARANVLREFLLQSTKKNRFRHREIYEVMDLCLSCKGCKSECPSNVDMATYKAEFLQHYYKNKIIPLRARLFAYITQLNQLAQPFYRVYNALITSKLTGTLTKKLLGIAAKRTFPKLQKHTLRKWVKKNPGYLQCNNNKKNVCFFIDEFTNYNDVEVGMKAIKLLHKLGYNIKIAGIKESGRTFLSKGFVKKARKIANKNLTKLDGQLTNGVPIVCLEPSAILSFRDEYIDLCSHRLKEVAGNMAKNAFMVDEFLEKEMLAGNISKELFTKEKKHIKLHGHCHQKALGDVGSSAFMLSFPQNFSVEEIPSGCCGMAGSFGYEKEHYDVSMKVGELVLFPAIRNSDEDIIIAAPGTSCRQQIMDGTARPAYHPVEILFDALL